MNDNMQPPSQGLVSIIMPTFNQEKFIGKAISSVIAQSYSEWELLVVNNMSSDDTSEVVKSFNDDRIKFFNFANQGVIAASRNYALSMARGEYIAFLDSDDYWAPEKLRVCVAKIKSGLDLVCHGEFFFKDGVEKFIPTQYGPEPNCQFEWMMTRGNCLSTSAIMIRSDILRRVGFFDESKIFNTAEDFDLWLRVVKHGAKVGILDELLGYYRLHAGSASASQVKNAKATLEVLKKHFNWENLTAIGFVLALLYQLRIRLFILRNQS
jgi:glycosyltransferase involved in cell wall biosynthesis